MRRLALLAVLALTVILQAAPAPGIGEPVNGFPNWRERVIHQWINRARVDPQVEMAACGSNCREGTCYAPVAPLSWNLALNHAALSGFGSGCHRYYFTFVDAAGATVTFPTTGSLAIGTGAGCPDWDASRLPDCGTGGPTLTPTSTPQTPMHSSQ